MDALQAGCIFGVMVVFSGLLILPGLRALRYARRKLRQECAPAEGRIVGYVTKRSGYGRFTSRWEAPVVEYTAGGQVYRLEYENKLSPQEHPVGTAVALRFDADAPERFHIEGDGCGERESRSVIRLGVLILAGTCALLLLLLDRRAPGPFPAR